MKSIPRQVTGYIIVGLAFLGWGLMRLFDAVQAGLKQGFGPNATLVIMGKLGYHAISVQGEIRSSCLPLVIGAVFIGVGVWSMRRASQDTL